jgi:hypothetical protein
MDEDRRTALIEECIAYETAERDAAPADEKHYWNEWSEEDMRAGTPFVLVNAQSPGLGRVTRFTAHLMIRGASGKCGSVRDIHMEKVSTGAAARRNGLDGYAERLAAKVYGPGIPVEYKRLV